MYLLIIAATTCYGKSKTDHTAGIQIKITGNIAGIKEIQLSYNNENEFDTENVIQLMAHPSKDGLVHFNLPDIKRLSKANIRVIYSKLKPAGISYYDSFLNYVMLPGDQINLAIHIEGITAELTSITGKGHLKYRCRYAMERLIKGLEKARIETGREILKKYNNNKPYVSYNADVLTRAFSDPEYLQHYVKNFDDYRQKIADTLDSYKEKLNEDVYAILRADALAYVDRTLEINILGIYNRFKPNGQPHVAKFYFQNLRPIEQVSDKTVMFSRYYIEAVFQREQILLLLKGHFKSFNDLPVKELYLRFKNNYSGKLKDMLLMLTVIDPRKNMPLAALPRDSAMRYIDKLIAEITDPLAKTMIQNSNLARIGPGTIPFNFKLKDTAGTLVALADFKGKVVVMDMWFYGCTGCAQFYKRFKTDIHPKFENNSFTTISINTDYGKEKWLKGIRQELYSDKNCINLQLDLPGPKSTELFADPMIKYYGLSNRGFPLVLLIGKNGKIIGDVTFDTSTEIIRKIAVALNENAL